MKEKRGKSGREEERSMTFPTFSLFIGPSVTFASLLVARRPPVCCFFEKFRFLSKERICVIELSKVITPEPSSSGT
jgi:hypothetical protein